MCFFALPGLKWISSGSRRALTQVDRPYSSASSSAAMRCQHEDSRYGCTDVPNSGVIHTFPATSSSLVDSFSFKYSRSAFSSSCNAHGKAILNMPVALT